MDKPVGKLPGYAMMRPDPEQIWQMMRTPKRHTRPSRAQLLASIAYLRHRSSTKILNDSKKLIEQSRQLIFETEFSFTGDD